MRKLSDAEVLGQLKGLKKRHRFEWSGWVYRSMVGRSISGLSKLSGYSRQWIEDHLKYYAAEEAADGVLEVAGLRGSSHVNDSHAVMKVIERHAPEAARESYVQDYEAEGITDQRAREVLAKSYEAAEFAIGKGIIRESKDQRERKVAAVVMPSGLEWDMRLKTACSRMKLFCKMLDEAKLVDLRRKITRVEVAKVHTMWMEQIDRIRNQHGTFDAEVEELMSE